MSDLGKIVPTGEGEYSASKKYEPLSIVRYKGCSWISKYDTMGNAPSVNSNYWQQISSDRDGDIPRCILVDNKGSVSSEYGFTYESLSAMLRNNTWQGVIKNNDYILLTAMNGDVFHMMFNIDTYYQYGNSATGHHIDMISRHLIPNSVGWQMRTENTNNGTDAVKNPFLASSNMIDKLNTYFANNIPAGLKSHIIDKRFLVPTRYSSTAQITDDTGWEWATLPKLWIPFEQEVSGRPIWGSKEWQGGSHQYPCFQDGSQIVKNNGESGGRAAWWLASAYSGRTTYFCYVGTDGVFSYGNASNTDIGVPLCFRFQ